MNQNMQLYVDDNLNVLRNLPDNSVDLIFCDILYNTGRTFEYYVDKLGEATEAMEWYEPRLKEMWRVVKDTGAVYLHCNYRLIHYLRVELDKVFGIDAFRNEVGAILVISTCRAVMRTCYFMQKRTTGSIKRLQTSTVMFGALTL